MASARVRETLSDRPATPPRSPQRSPCSVSVVVPTLNRPDLLDRCLRELVRQTLDRSHFEIIVVDDGPHEQTRRVVERWRSQAGCPAIRYLPNDGPHGPAAARNKGWRASEAAVIAFTDDDCVPSPFWLRAGLDALDDPDGPLDAVCGRIVVPLPERPSDYQRTVAGMERAEFATANTLCRRAALETVGGFDERFPLAWREDSDLQFTLMERGFRVAADPRPVVIHPVRPAPWGISLRLQRLNVFNALLFKKHPILYRRRIQSSPPWRYYFASGAGAGALAAAGVGWGGTAAALAGLWLAATLRFCAQRLMGTSRAPRHVAEMIVTSILIPPLAIFWRMVGAVKYRTAFL